MEKNEQTQVESRKLNPMLIGAVVLVLIIAAIGFALTQNNTSNTNIQDQETLGTTALSEDRVGETADVVVVNIEAGNYSYSPSEIRVKQGDTVRIEMMSIDMRHDLVIDELGLKMPVVEEGNSASIEFIASQVGSFEFYCGVGDHREQGQVGMLIVE